MYFHIICTLFDITNTGVTSYSASANNLKARNQQRNWQVVQQLIQLRTQPLIILNPTDLLVNINNYEFGTNHRGQHRVWFTVFAVDRTEIYKSDTDSTAYLKIDFDRIPMIVGLDETVKVDKNYLITTGPDTNICFYTREQWPDNDYLIDFRLYENEFGNK